MIIIQDIWQRLSRGAKGASGRGGTIWLAHGVVAAGIESGPIIALLALVHPSNDQTMAQLPEHLLLGSHKFPRTLTRSQLPPVQSSDHASVLLRTSISTHVYIAIVIMKKVMSPD